METTIVYRGLCGDNGKEDGNHYIVRWNMAAGSMQQLGCISKLPNSEQTEGGRCTVEI